MPRSNSEHPNERKSSPTRTLLSREQHRAQAAYLKQFPGPNAQRAAQLHEVAARMIEGKSRAAVGKGPDSYAAQRVAEKLAFAKQNLDHYTKLAANPKLSPMAAEAARQSARSHQAAVKLYQRALDYERQKPQARRDQTANIAVPAATAEQVPMTFDKALAWFANAWVTFIAVLNLIGIVGIVVTAPTVWNGIAKIQEIYSPFNFWNWLAEAVALSPAVGAIAWKNRRRKQRAASH